MNTFPYKRIVVIGTTSSGKSTLAKQIAERLDLDFIELDALHWEPNWKEADNLVLWDRVDKAIQPGTWVVAGNYKFVRDLVWRNAEAAIWLDFPLPILFWRLLTRTIRRWVTQEELWNGNREKLWWHFKLWSEESLFHWLFKTYWRRKKEYSVLLSQPEYAHLKVFHFEHTREAEKWLNDIG